MSEARTTLDIEALKAQLPIAAEKVFAQLLEAALDGLRDAQYLLAQMYMEGKGVQPDAASALHWYTVAASQGDRLAMNMVGRCHELGQGTVADPAMAAVWYRRAAEHGLDWGMYNHANLLATGRGVPQDRARAFALYSQAAQLGHAKSMNLVGRHLEEGWETPADPQAALRWYRKSAEAGDFRGQASYASILLQHGDVEQAAHWLQRALRTGSPSFLAHIVPTLAQSQHAAIRSLVASADGQAVTASAQANAS